MSAALDRFFDHYYRRRPVNATFTGLHSYDTQLPDWSEAGIESMDAEMRSVHAELASAHPVPPSPAAFREDVDGLDAELARGFLEIQLAENAGSHGIRQNPALWTGEAIFSVVSLMTRDFSTFEGRLRLATARLRAMPAFLAQGRQQMTGSHTPEAWMTVALRECEGASILLTRGADAWLASGGGTDADRQAFKAAADAAAMHLTEWARGMSPQHAAPNDAAACGPEHYDLLLRRGHQCTESPTELLRRARACFDEAKVALDAMAATAAGSWSGVQEQLAVSHPPADDYLLAFANIWEACHDRAVARDVIAWPDWPIRYVPFPEWTREAAPYLYYLYYRSPAPFDRYTAHDYVVPPLPAADAEKHLRNWNDSVIKLNHVVHHGAIGHHVQNWNAYHRARSRVGKVAAVDCACRIGMFCGGTMAEGWACYATELMEELDFLSPLERVSQQHSRVRFLARAIVDIEFHQRTFSFDDAVRFWVEQVGADPKVARAEVVKCSMFPATAVMYWIGTQGILDLRESLRRARGDAFSLKRFHEELLGFGSIPVPLVARIMTADVA